MTAVLVDLEELRRIIREEMRAAARATDEPTAEAWLDTEQAAAVLGVHARTLRRLVRTQHLPTHRVAARTFRYRRDELEAWMARRGSKGSGR